MSNAQPETISPNAPPRGGPAAGRTAGAARPLPTLPGQADRLLRQLEWNVVRKLDGLLQGDYRTLMRGSGLDLADLREYQPHDDVRHIDWNVTARLNTPHVRVFTEDREMSAWFLLDLSPSINFGPPGNAKRDILTGFVAVLARLLTRHGNRVGAMLYGAGGGPERVVDAVLPPRSSRAHVLHLVHRLLQPAPAQQAGATQLQLLLQTALGNIRRRSTVLVVSDFISTPGWEKPLAQLARRHDVVAVRLLDPLELNLPDIGLISLFDPETGEQLQVDTTDKGFRHRFARLAAEREAALRAGLTQAGADTLELCTDDDLVDALLRFMDLRLHRVRPAFNPSHYQPATQAA